MPWKQKELLPVAPVQRRLTSDVSGKEGAFFGDKGGSLLKTGSQLKKYQFKSGFHNVINECWPCWRHRRLFPRSGSIAVVLRLLFHLVLVNKSGKMQVLASKTLFFLGETITSLDSCLGVPCGGALAALEASALLCCFCNFLNCTLAWSASKFWRWTCMPSSMAQSRTPCYSLASAG